MNGPQPVVICGCQTHCRGTESPLVLIVFPAIYHKGEIYKRPSVVFGPLAEMLMEWKMPRVITPWGAVVAAVTHIHMESGKIEPPRNQGRTIK